MRDGYSDGYSKIIKGWFPFKLCEYIYFIILDAVNINVFEHISLFEHIQYTFWHIDIL